MTYSVAERYIEKQESEIERLQERIEALEEFLEKVREIVYPSKRGHFRRGAASKVLNEVCNLEARLKKLNRPQAGGDND